MTGQTEISPETALATMKVLKFLGVAVLVFLGGCAALIAWGGRSPDTAEEYADRYGGSATSYENILRSTDCQWLGKTAADMDERYNRPSESRETQRMALGFQRAAVDRMVALDCP